MHKIPRIISLFGSILVSAFLVAIVLNIHHDQPELFKPFSSADLIGVDTPPTIVSSIDDLDGLINAEESSTGFTIMIITTGIEDGQSTSCMVSSDGGGSAPETTTTINGSTASVTSGSIVELTDGSLTINCSAIDSFGNNAVETHTTAILDTTAPGEPIIGSIADDNIINALESRSIHILGTAETESTVNVLLSDGNSEVNASTTATDGNFFITIDGTAANPASLIDGLDQIMVTANASDKAGNISTNTITLVTQDTLEPEVPIIISIAVDNIIQTDELSSIEIIGTAEPGSTLNASITDGSNTGESTGPGDLEGNFSIILDGTSATPEALQDGENTHTVIVTARDSAGNISNQSLKVISQDTNDPTEPIITSIAGDNIINAVEKSAIIVEGSAEPYSTVSVGITDGTSSISGNTTCDATGVFEISLNGNNALPETLIDGTDHITISIIAIDTVGNSSEEIKSIASQDTVKPNQPAVSTPTNGSIIDDSTVTDVQISGTTESGNMVTVILYDGDQIIQSSEISEDGSYTLSIDTTILKDGDNKISVTVKAQDLGGNTSDEVSLTLSKHTTEGAAAEAALVASQSSSSNSISSSNSGGGNGGAGGGGGGGGGSGNEGNENSSGILSVYDPNYSNPELEKVIAARKTEKTITGPVTAELVGMVLQNNGDELINAVITKGIGYLLQTDNQSTLALFIPKDTHVVAKKIWDLVIHPPEIVSRNIIRRSGAIILGSSEKLMQESIRTIISAGSDITALYFTEAISLQVPMSVSEQDKVRVYRSEDKEIWELMSDEDIHVSQNNVVINSDKLSSFAIQVESATSHPASVIDPDLPFEDAQGHWAKDYIKELYQKQIISGKTLSTFAPDEPITRAELTKIALNAFQVQLPKSIDEIPFADVSTDEWFTPYLVAAKEHEIVKGDGENFRPNDFVNRAEALKILIETAGFPVSEGSSVEFPDTPKDQWYIKYVSFGKDKEIIKGYPDGNFKPQNLITRAETAKIMSMILQLNTQDLVSTPTPKTTKIFKPQTNRKSF